MRSAPSLTPCDICLKRHADAAEAARYAGQRRYAESDIIDYRALIAWCAGSTRRRARHARARVMRAAGVARTQMLFTISARHSMARFAAKIFIRSHGARIRRARASRLRAYARRHGLRARTLCARACLQRVAFIILMRYCGRCRASSHDEGALTSVPAGRRQPPRPLCAAPRSARKQPRYLV